jgi:predicted ATPase/DNA-binding CsgD family transcriptional regulator
MGQLHVVLLRHPGDKGNRTVVDGAHPAVREAAPRSALHGPLQRALLCCRSRRARTSSQPRPRPATFGGVNGLSLMSDGFPPHNLPPQRTSLIGREEDIVTSRSVLLGTDGRLLTLTGAGGCGKTRLALSVAEALLESFADGVWLVELAAVRDPDFLPRAVAAVFSVPEAPRQSVLEALVARLEPRRSLLVIDNCEQLVDASARLVQRLLDGCPHLRILATSREALRVAGEVVWRVPPLAVPDPRKPATVVDIETVPAVRLFVERAQAAQRAFRLTDQNCGGVANLVTRLAGLPLAIELAAAQVRVLGVNQILERMARDVHLLAEGSRLAPDRHQTLRATLDWSYDLLSDAERTLIRRLSVFAGDWSLEAAEAISADDHAGAAAMDIACLRHLVDLSLVESYEAEANPRYRLLEPVREYARERLVSCGELAVIQRRHAMYYVELAERLEPGSRIGGPRRVVGQALLEREYDNCRVALQWCVDNSESDLGVRLANALALLWVVRSRCTEGLHWLQRFIDLSNPSARLDRPLAMAWAIQLAARQGNHTLARKLREEGVVAARATGDQYVIHNMLQSSAMDAYESGEYAVARAYLEEAIAVNRAAGSDANVQLCVAACLRHLGRIAWLEGDLETARAHCEAALRISRDIGDDFETANSLTVLGNVLLYQGELTSAQARFYEGLAASREAGARWSLAGCQRGLGDVAAAEGRLEDAARWLAASLRGYRDSAMSDLSRVADALESWAKLSSSLGQPDRAVRLAGASAALRDSTGAALSPIATRRLERWCASLRRTLGGPGFAEHWTAGYGLSLEHAVELALSAVTSDASLAATHSAARPVDVTRREMEVAALVARGLTNREIAEKLVVSERTAEWHVARILTRLGLKTRAQIAAWVARRGTGIAIQS